MDLLLEGGGGGGGLSLSKKKFGGGWGGGAQAPCSYAFANYINGFIERKSYEFVKMLDKKMSVLVFVRCHFHFGDFMRITNSFKLTPQDTFIALIVMTS